MLFLILTGLSGVISDCSAFEIDIKELLETDVLSAMDSDVL